MAPPAPSADAQLKEFARRLADTHANVIVPKETRQNPANGPKTGLLSVLPGWEKTLQQANASLKARPPKDASISRASAWLLDNFYVIKQTIRQIEAGLPRSFLDQLPILTGTPLKGQPRSLALAREWLETCQSQLDLAQVAIFVQEYQQVTPLTIGELWALPTLLRLGLLEQLVNAVLKLTGLEAAPATGASLPPTGQLASEGAALPLASDIRIANCFTSLRLLSATDWNTFFEQVSRVEQILRQDPAGLYPHMDFETRNSYRSVVEDLARHSTFSEEAVAQFAVELARAATEAPLSKTTHLGFYLRAAGRAVLETRVGYQPGFNLRLHRALLAAPTFWYLGSIALFTTLFVGGLLAYAVISGGSWAQNLVVSLLGAGLALETAIALVNWNVTHRIKPQSLPRMDFSTGIPPGHRTMVVVPTLLESASELHRLLQDLEIYHLANSDPQVTFALLTDFGDAPEPHQPGEAALLDLARAGIDKLNQKASSSGSNPAPYYLFHRPRQWNPSEGVWMGWERKRGKLADFNRLLLNLGEADPEADWETAYTTQVGEVSRLSEIRYVITLDADTSLPQGSANRLIATLAHPLNQAEFAADGRSVVSGYTVLQPRVAIKPTSANHSPFAQIFAGNAGFDLYSFAVSDVYQDLFGEGSYVGKGIYEVATFERSLAGQVRQNTLLSHDLFEGIYGRAALVTDIVLYEEYPSSYLGYARRLRRWIRGDWQLLPWLFPHPKTKDGVAPNRLALINLWKVFDNLRRSLLAPTQLALLTAGWLFLPGSPLVWTLLVLLPSAWPMAAQTLQHGQQNPGKLTFAQLFQPVVSQFQRWALSILFLPYEALLMLGAIRTTLARLTFSRKNLLQWTTAANTARAFGAQTSAEIWVEMAASLGMTVLLGVAVALFNPPALWVALPLLAAWLVAPHIASRLSQPVTHVTTPLSEPQRRQILRLARRTWAFFEKFVGPDDHWLPPDHFQEAPRGSVAHYTTPTNIGLFLVSTLAAYDLGYLGLLELNLRLRATFESLAKLEHYRGHLLNWYDSLTLTALPPRYISTVDSGNLAACLVTVKQGCLALEKAPVLGAKQWQGLLALLDILSEALQSLEKNNPEADTESFEVELTTIYARVSAIQHQPSAWKMTLNWLAGAGWERVSHRLLELLASHPNLQSAALTELQLYLDLLHHHLQDMQRSLDLFAPWLNRLDAPLWETPAGQAFSASLPTELPTLGQAAAVYGQILAALQTCEAQSPTESVRAACQSLAADLSAAQMAVLPLLIGFRDLAGQANTALLAMEFRFLFSEQRQVFHIGYNVSTERLDPSYYDLLASEARIASLIAIAKGDVLHKHWQHLGRPITQVNGRQVLLSWSGTMFEYLMPTLFLKNYAGTFLAESCYAALEAQIAYGRKKQAPWGISESGYYAFDLNQNYQYRAFGVPDLGYQRDLPEDLVIAPYASLLGLSLQPQAVLANLAQLEQANLLGQYGFYEALDRTQTRLPEKNQAASPPGQAQARVLSYMAHHQGMILLSACNYLLENVMVERFHADERIQSIELLLQEKIPENPPLEYPHPDEPSDVQPGVHAVNSAPWRVPVASPLPQAHLLAQGEASLLLTNAGGGYSQWRELALTRWQADSTLDAWGTWIYVQDRESGALWSATCQPLGTGAEQQEVLFYPHKVEFPRTENGITLRTGVTLSPEGVEIRRVNILNDSDRPRRLKLTSYGEVVLAEQAADRRHPAFNKLFIESEYLPQENALLFTRRPRSAEEKPVVLIHALVGETGRRVTGQHETDRAQFLGRSQTARTPQALENAQRPLSGTTGGTLDPIFSLAQEIDLKPHAKTRVSFLTLAAPTRAAALEKLSHYRTGQAIYRAFQEARTASERELVELGLNAPAVENIERLLSALLYPVGTLRPAPHLLAQNERGQTGLWAFGISGDLPILLVRIRDGESALLPEALQAFTYWRAHHLPVNLVILNEEETGYALDLHNAIQRQIHSLGAEGALNQREGIFILRADQLQPAEKSLLQAVAGVVLDEKDGSLAEHALRLTFPATRLPKFTPALASTAEAEPTPALPRPTDLRLENGLGGFSPDGREYVLPLAPGQQTPQPWINVIANAQFGFFVSAAGSGPTWAVNSGENRLTPWRNDPVSDQPGEVLYLRDEETGQVWSPTPLPAGAENAHLVRHGAGYSIFESQSHGLHQKLSLFVAPAAPVKIARLRLKNLWQRPRRLTVTYYAEWVLGTTRETQQAQILPEFSPERHALLASNRYNPEFGERVAFLAANKKPHGVTTDRTEFLGRLGSLSSPAALQRIGLDSAVNAGLDPCAALQLHVDLAPGAEEEICFFIGEAANRVESLALLGQLQAAGQVEAVWQAVQQEWDQILNTVQVETPDPGLNLLLNRWLLYQTLSCRLWGRTALYQSSGAFGFRDQLQDVLALLHTRPDLVRTQILEAAQHQFEAGDVLHWWNPPAGRGVRTRFSDDLLWLPFVTAEYVTATGDASILIKRVPFLQGEPLKPAELERYAQFAPTEACFSLYEHCRRALERGATRGAHGLPLMGAGDWNDGMNRVGIEGRGESIWLGWFLHATLTRFAALATQMLDDPAPYLRQAATYAEALETQAWDGEWYLRAFYDDGSRLGSRVNRECQIDSIAQSWAVLAEAAPAARAAQAMEAVHRRLVNPQAGLILLFAPPFDQTERDPGYIKGYLPGVRENGGQYTHAAIWTAWAFAKLGQGNRAWELFRQLSPLSHAETPAQTARYRVEPYVIAADIYSQAEHFGRGGWTWYTGAAGWMYRLGLEAILGISRVGQSLNVAPCIPQEWPGFKVIYRDGTDEYHFSVENPQQVNRGVRQIWLDGKPLPGSLIPLSAAGQIHTVRVVLGEREPA